MIAMTKTFQIIISSFSFRKWVKPGLFIIYFRLFKHTLQFLQQINVKNSQGIPIRQIFACVLVDFE